MARSGEDSEVSPLETSAVVFVFLAGGIFCGMLISAALPDHHLDAASKEVVRLGMGVIATMSALVLGLVIGDARSTFDAEAGALRSSAADVLMLDRVLSEYGPETGDARGTLKRSVAHRLGFVDGSGDATLESPEVAPRVGHVEAQIRSLAPGNDSQRELRAQALSLVSDLMKTRLLALEAAEEAIPTVFLVVLVLWLSALFWSFGLYAPRNATVVAVLLLCAASVAASIFVILEMSDPFTGMVRVSGAPLRFALENLGR
jgi:hypothetical protein